MGTWVIPAMWLVWCVYWWRAAADVKAAIRRETVGSRLRHIVPLTIAALLVGLPSVPVFMLDDRFLPRTWSAYWIGAAIVAAGLSFTVWARLVLARNWSGTVTVKAEHELVTAGPYRLVRHPIYSGLLLAFAGSAVARGEWRGVLAVLVASAALWWKLRLEERWMTETFGPAYVSYRKSVAALIPFVL